MKKEEKREIFRLLLFFYFQVNIPVREEHYTPPSSPNINHASAVSASQVIKSFTSSTYIKFLEFKWNLSLNFDFLEKNHTFRFR